MSRENVETVREWVAAINRGDADMLVELADPNVDYLPYLGIVSGARGAYQGHEGLRRYVRDLHEAWGSYYVEIRSLRDVGDHVIMEGSLRATGATSGVEVDAVMAWLHTFSPGTGFGRYLRLRFYDTPRQALEAAGVSE
jgi:ketosteroid isomerase-like protein